MTYTTSIFDSIQTEEQKKSLISTLKKEMNIDPEKYVCTDYYSVNYKMLEYKVRKLEQLERASERENIKKSKYNTLETFSLSFTNKEIILQFELYHQCKIRGIECYLEVNVINDKKKIVGSIDACLKIKDKFFVIECKTCTKDHIYKYADQLLKYKKLRSPIIVLLKSDQIHSIIDILENEYIGNEVYLYDDLNKKLSSINLY